MFKKLLKKVWNLNVFDWAILKICVAVAALMIAVLIPALVQVKRWIYGIVFAVTYIYVLLRMFRK